MRSGVLSIFPALRAAFCRALALFPALAQVNRVRAAFVSCFFALAVFAAQAAVLTHSAAAQINAAADMTLQAEIQEDSPSLVTVIQALDAGANPNATVTGGLPLLFEAGRLGHADIVSVLVTFGVNASVQFGSATFPEHMSANGFDFNTGRTTIPWRDAAEVVIHFGEALKVFALTSATGAAYNWNVKGANWPAEHLRSRYDSAALVNNNPEARAVMEVMAGYMLDQGSVCPERLADHAICASRPECTATGGLLYSCSECAGFPHLDGNRASCVPQCGSYATLNAAAWPSSQCECDHGETNPAGECPSLPDVALAAEVEKTNPVLSSVRALLNAGASPDAAGTTGRVPLLIVAATIGHADIVSVLVTVGANVNAADSTFSNFNVAHHMATHLNDPAAGPRVLRAAVLHHFSAALDVRNARFGDADFDWNQEADGGRRALDLLVNAAKADKLALDGENFDVIHEMAEHMRGRGARCGSRSGGLNEVCLGTLGAPLMRAVQDPNTSAVEVRALAQAMLAAGADPDTVESVSDGGHVLAVAARSGHAAAVSVLLTFRVSPNGRDSNGRSVPHIAGRNSESSAPLQLQVLRRFIGGLDAAGKAASFNGWNAGSDIGRPLDALQTYGAAVQEAVAAKREIQALLYERGARCASPEGKTYCRIPAGFAVIPTNVPDTGAVLTVTARDFGGTSFDLRLPDAAAVAAMSVRGWRMDRFYGPPRRVELSRTRPLLSGDDFPTVAVTMLNGEQAVRRINIADQSGLSPLFVTVVGFGSVSIVADGKPFESGGSILPDYHVKIVAAPDSAAYHVSGWSGPCANARKGADGGERTCEFIFNREDNRVTVNFSPGRLGRYLPATGDIPDGRVAFRNTGNTAIEYFCRLFGGFQTAEFVPGDARLVCAPFGGAMFDIKCDSPGDTGFDDHPDCGSSYFRRIRDCNAQNKPIVVPASASAPGACREQPCDAAAGMVALGRSCTPVSDQCAASPPPGCDAQASCSDPNVYDDNTPAQLCTCNVGFHGNGVSCMSTTPTIERFPFFVTVVGQGSVRIRAGEELIQSGDGIQANLSVNIVAAPGNGAYHVSDWTGPCAGAPKGADGGERTCGFFFFNQENNRVTVTFSPGRLAPHLPLSGDVSDSYLQRIAGETRLNYYCKLLSGVVRTRSTNNGPKDFCDLRQRSGVATWCSSSIDSDVRFGGVLLDRCVGRFTHIRDCNRNNLRGSDVDFVSCGGPCDAEAGMAARGRSCQTSGDQCAAPFAPPACDAQAVCSDPDVRATNTPAELCTCPDGLAGDGVTCGRQSASAALLAEVQKPPGAANVSMVLTLLGFGANSNIADGNEVAALIIAATLGHAEIVSVLVTAGADANARWNNGNSGRAVPHVAAINNFDFVGATLHYPWKTALNVLRHFADAVNQKGATYDWDSIGGGSHRAVEYLHYRYNHAGAAWGGNAVWPAESVSVKYEAMEEMTDILLENGDDCRPHPDRVRHVTCQGSLRAALAEVVALGASETSAADVRAAAQTVAAAGINPKTARREAVGNLGGYIVGIAAARGHAEAVSILVTFGADAGGKTQNNRAALHHVGRGSDTDAPSQLTVLRYFIGGLRAAGMLDAFAGWNAGSDIGRPLEALHGNAVKNSGNLAAKRETQKLLWEGGARCEHPADKTYCQIPREEQIAAAYSAGDGLTVRGRDFRGTVFVFSPPSAESAARLAAAGWRTTLESSEEELVILRTRQPLPSDASVEFTVTAFAGAGGDAVRVYDIEAAATATVGVSYKTVPDNGSFGRVSASGEGLIGTNAAYAGSRVTFTATPEPGYGVFAWETNGADCPRGALECAAVAPVNSDLLVTARFALTSPAGYGEIPDDKSGGTLTAEGLAGEDGVFSGTTVTFRARPAAGWLFSAWEGDGAGCSPSDLECALLADDDGLFVTVRFTQGRLVEYQADPSDESGGTLTAAGLARDNTALAGAPVTFTASPALGWELSAWEGDVGSCAAPDLECILTADDDLRVTASFSQAPRIRYESNPSEASGRVAVAGADGNADGADFVYSGGTVTFTATPEPGWELSAWEGDVGSCAAPDLKCVLTVNDDLRVTALFSQAPRIRYESNPSEASGRVAVVGADGNADGEDFAYSGGTVTFTATPAFGWEVAAWAGDVGSCIAPAVECEAAVNMDLYVTVRFSRVTVRVEAANIPAEGGSVTVQLSGPDYAFLGSDATFTATPADGWYAAGWEGLGTAGCAGLECVVMIATEADLLVTVRFAEVEAPTVRVEYAGDPPYAGTLSAVLPGLDFAFLGATVTFTAKPSTDWLVEGWAGEGTADCAAKPQCAVAADGDLHVTVRFAPVARATVRVAYETAPDGGRLTVELPGSDFAFAGASVTFKATPMAGWTIAAWEGDAVVTCPASSLTCVLIAGSDLAVGARFRQYDCVAENREGSGSECGECLADYGEMGIYCVEKATGDFGIAPQSEICRALQGGGKAARLEGDGEMKVCSGVDANDTFCILDSVDGLPCRGLFRHVLRCNMEFNRLALNPFFCGKKCDDDPSKPRAVGGECRP